MSSFRLFFLLVATLVVTILPLLPTAVFARVIPQSSSPSPEKFDFSVLTWGEYRGKSIYLPGTWSVDQSVDAVAFSKSTQAVRATTIDRDDCGYTRVRIRAQKAWGTTSLQQSQARLRVAVLGRSDYQGYTWYEPSEGDWQNRFWCLQQDAKKAVLLSIVSSDSVTLRFAEQNLIRQFATRRATR